MKIVITTCGWQVITFNHMSLTLGLTKLWVLLLRWICFLHFDVIKSTFSSWKTNVLEKLAGSEAGKH
jgi:hypothetical protein